MTCLHNEPPCDCGDRDCPECGLPRPSATFDNIPDGWRVLWCPECGYSVTFTEAAWVTYTEDEWNTLLWQEAVAHAHAAELSEVPPSNLRQVVRRALWEWTRVSPDAT